MSKKIERLGLVDKVIPALNAAGGQWDKACAELYQICGEKISPRTLQRYMRDLTRTDKKKYTIEQDKKHLTKLLTEDAHTAKVFLDKTAKDLIKIYNDKRADKDTDPMELLGLADAIVGSPSLKRIYNHHGIGKSSPQINLQFNNYIESKMTEMIQILKEELDDTVFVRVAQRFQLLQSNG